MNNNSKITMLKHSKAQQGMALVVTLVVLLGLTVLALASTNSNLGQSIMVRNSQFRLEEFNASYAEIEGQVDAINNSALSAGVPDYVINLIDGIVPKVYSDASTSDEYLAIKSPTPSGYMRQKVEQVYDGRCFVFGEEVGAGNDKIRCDQMRIESSAGLNSRTKGGSEQNQVYRYKTLAL